MKWQAQQLGTVLRVLTRWSSCARCSCAAAVVFGRVVEGMPVVKRIEVCGTRSGKPTKKVQVTDCGQLPSRMQMLQQLRQEKEEMAKLRSDPLQVDPDAEARKRLAELKAQLAGSKAAGGAAVAGGSQQGDAAAAHGRSEQQEPAGPSSGAGEEDGEEAGGVPEGADPYEGMSARQRKLHELRAKLQQCRKANQSAVIAEKKRNKVCGGWGCAVCIVGGMACSSGICSCWLRESGFGGARCRMLITRMFQPCHEQATRNFWTPLMWLLWLQLHPLMAAAPG